MHTCGHAGAGLVKLAQAHSSGGSIRGSHMQRRERLQDYYYKRSTRRHRRHGTRPTYVDQHLSLRKRPKATGTQNQPLAYHARRHGKHREHARHSPRGHGANKAGKKVSRPSALPWILCCRADCRRLCPSTDDLALLEQKHVLSLSLVWELYSSLDTFCSSL